MKQLIMRIFSFFYLGGILFLWSSPYWPPSLWWLATLLQMVPLWGLTAPLAIFLFVVLFQRKRTEAIVSGIFLCIVIFGIMGFEVPDWQTKGKQSYGVRVMTANLGEGNDFDALLKYIKSVDPDIIAFQEAVPETEFFVQNNFPKWDTDYREHLALASKFPILEAEVVNRRMLQRWGGIVGKYKLQGPAGPIDFFNVHLESPRRGIEAIVHDQLSGIAKMKKVTVAQETESAVAAKWISSEKSALIAGDFNMLVTNPIYRKYWSKFNNAFSQKGFGFGFTLRPVYHDRRFTMFHTTRIDHILADSDWQVLTARLGPDLGGDHLPVIADLAFTGELSTEILKEERPQLQLLVPVPPRENILAFEDFESSFGRFANPGQADLTLDRTAGGVQGKALKVQMNSGASQLSAGVALRIWPIEEYSVVRFLYMIPPGTPVLMRVKTSFGDWLCVGGTALSKCPNLQGQKTFTLADDGQWHHIDLDVKESVQSVLSALKYLQAFEFHIPQNRFLNDTFWIDDFMIIKP